MEEDYKASQDDVAVIQLQGYSSLNLTLEVKRIRSRWVHEIQLVKSMRLDT